jgi:hypothetical protein
MHREHRVKKNRMRFFSVPSVSTHLSKGVDKLKADYQ